MLSIYIKVGTSNCVLDIDEKQVIHLVKQSNDITDITKKTGEVSLNIAIQRTLNNDDVFAQLWHVNTNLNSFDLNKSYEAVIQLDNITIEGRLMMNSISYGGGNNIYNAVAYNVQFLSLGASFFNDVQEYNLTDLGDYIERYEHTFSAANIEASFSNDYTDGYVYPMLLTNGTAINLTEFRPSHYVRNLFDMVHRAVGKTWTLSGVDMDLFNKLVLINASKGLQQSIDDYTVRATNSETLTEPTHAIGTSTTWASTLTTFTEQLDVEGLFNPTTGVYTVPYEVLAGSAISVRFSADVDIRLSTASTAYLVSGFITSKYTYRLRLQVYNSSNVMIAQHLLGLNQFDFQAGDDFTNSYFLGNVSGNFELLISNLTQGETITFKLAIVSSILGSAFWRDGATTGDALVNVDCEIELNSSSFEIVPPPYTIVSGDTVNMRDWLPTGYKAKDFVKDIMTLFNLVCEVSSNEVKYYTRDEYYNTADVYELDDLVALDKGFERRFLFQENVKKLTLSYKSASDYYNEVYTSNTSEVFGQANYFFNNNRRNEEVKTVTLLPMPVAVNDCGVVVPAITAAENVGARIGLHNGSTTASYTIVSPTTPTYSATTAPLISHYDELNDLCFGTPEIVFISDEPPAGNLFNRYYRNTFSTLENGEILNIWAWISPNNYRYFDLRSKFLLFGKLWVLNKMDYNANGLELAQLELVTISNIELPFKPPRKPTQNKPSKRPTYNLINLLNNVDNSGGGAVVTGLGNVAQEGYEGILSGRNNNSVYPEKSVAQNVRVVSYDTTVEDDDYCIIFTGANKTVTVPLASDNVGRILIGKNNSSGNMTFQRSGSDLIEGGTTAVIPSGGSGTIISDGLNWWVISIV